MTGKLLSIVIVVVVVVVVIMIGARHKVRWDEVGFS